jgi:multidrug resistance efflux pump
MTTSQRVYIEEASIQAPLINLAPSAPGILQEVYVHEGDLVNANTPVARVGNELVKAKVAGVIVSVPETIGAQVTPAQAVVAMIDPKQLRVVGEVDENKGLDRIKIGDPVTFTVDAFGKKQFSGIIDEVAPTANSAGIVFNISGTRSTQQFDVKARFDSEAYSALKNGMSARMWVYDR